MSLALFRVIIDLKSWSDNLIETWPDTLSNSLGEKVIVQENYVRIKNLVKLFIEFVRQKTITRLLDVKKLVITNLETLLGNTITKLEIKKMTKKR